MEKITSSVNVLDVCLRERFTTSLCPLFIVQVTFSKRDKIYLEELTYYDYEDVLRKWSIVPIERGQTAFIRPGKSYYVRTSM